MSLYRSVSDRLAQWRNEPTRKALLVRKHKSLDNVMAVGEWGIDHALVFCPGNVQCAGPVTYLPWYLLMFFSPETDEPLLVSW